MSRESLVGIRAPEFVGTSWINSNPLTLKGLLEQEKTVLIDFWTYSCINCIRTMPYLKKWWDKYRDQGLAIIGVHSPEFDFEKNEENIRQAMKDLGISWPVLNDADHLTWKAYNNHYWPRHLLLNHQGKIVYDHIGEGSYQETEAAIQQALIDDQGAIELPEAEDNDHKHKLGAVCHPTNPETYLGSIRGHLKNSETGPKFVNPNSEQPGVSLEGNWQIEDNFITPGPEYNPKDYLSLIFSATEVNLVAQAPTGAKLKVTLNNMPIPADFRGEEIIEEKDETWLMVKSPRMYRLIKSSKYLSPAELKIEATNPDFKAYVFTFGGCSEAN